MIRWATTASVVLLAGIAAIVSYRHMHTLVELHGESSWTAALLPFSVDGMIAASSMALLLDSRYGRRGGVLPWALLVAGSVASLAANVAVAEPTPVGRVIAAWPSFALIGAYELLMRQIRHAAATATDAGGAAMPAVEVLASVDGGGSAAGTLASAVKGKRVDVDLRSLQRQAWQWALCNRQSNGYLPTGKAIAQQFGRHERWGRLVKNAGRAGLLQPGPDAV